MKSRISLIIVLALAALLVGTVAPQPPAAKAQSAEPTPELAEPLQEWAQMSAENRADVENPLTLAPDAANATDRFGYTWSETAAADGWKDVSVGVTQVFTKTDDSVSTAIPIGFSFKFYEKTYTQVYINSNGMLNFGKGSTSRDVQPMPQEPSPNDFLAPLWADLAIGGEWNSGDVVYKQGSGYFVVAWRNVTGRYSPKTDLLNFQVILYSNGDIRFVYQTLVGLPESFAVGIEDYDGADGLTYSYKTSFSAPRSILFTRPATSPRAKLLPILQGGFAQNRQAAFQVAVSNVGDDASASDIFNLTSSITTTGWSASFWSADGLTALTDHDANGQPDTGSLAKGGVFTTTVKITAASTILTPSGARVLVSATSHNAPARQATGIIQVALPTKFAQAFSNQSGLNLGLYDPSSLGASRVDSWFGGSNMSLSSLNQGLYAFSWERSASKDLGNGNVIYYTDAEYMLLNPSGQAIIPTSKLTNNQSVTKITTDLSPMMVATPNGVIGAIWIHAITDPVLGINANLFFARLNADGTPQAASTHLNLTNNSAWQGETTKNVPVFFSPRIVATKDNRFVLVWFDERYPSLNQKLSDVWYTILGDSNGDGTFEVLLTPRQLTTGVAGSLLYSFPAITLLSNGQVFISYTRFDDNLDQYGIAYTAINSSGQVLQQGTVSGAQGTRSDVVQFASGRILLAWTDSTVGRIGYTVLDGSTFASLYSPKSLTGPERFPRVGDFVSVTTDRQNRGVLTWMDQHWNQRLYYALVDDSANRLVDPMPFLIGESENVLVQTSFTGYGNAPRPEFVFLPMIRR
jgi:hypothetical protein